MGYGNRRPKGERNTGSLWGLVYSFLVSLLERFTATAWLILEGGGEGELEKRRWSPGTGRRGWTVGDESTVCRKCQTTDAFYIEEIVALRAECQKAYNTFKEAHDKMKAERDRFRMALESIEKHIQIVTREGMTPMSVVYQIARKALSGPEGKP